MPRDSSIREARDEISDLIAQVAQVEDRQYKRLRSNRVSSAVAREALFLETFEKIVRTYIVGRYTPPAKHPRAKKGKTPRILQTIWSDHHYGSDLDPKEVPLRYGPVEEARRLSLLVKELVEYKTRYREETTLRIGILGDMIQGQLHDPRDGAPLSMQLTRLIHNATRAISYLSGHFSLIEVGCVPGNHGRITSRHPDRAVHQKWDSNETVAYQAIKMALESHPNVRVDVHTTPHFVTQAFGSTCFLTHGDTVIKPGNPHKTISVANLRNQVNEWNAASEGKKHAIFAVGHVHIGTHVNLPGDVSFFTNGCLVPTDSYALSLGAPNPACGQWMWESVPGHPVGDARYVKVNADTDKDASLDRIVPPFEVDRYFR